MKDSLSLIFTVFTVKLLDALKFRNVTIFTTMERACTPEFNSSCNVSLTSLCL